MGLIRTPGTALQRASYIQRGYLWAFPTSLSLPSKSALDSSSPPTTAPRASYNRTRSVSGKRRKLVVNTVVATGGGGRGSVLTESCHDRGFSFVYDVGSNKVFLVMFVVMFEVMFVVMFVVMVRLSS